MKLPASFVACGAVLVFRDISQRRQIERDRAILLDHEREARAEVERLVARQRHLHSVTDTALSARALDELVPELLARLRVAMASDTQPTGCSPRMVFTSRRSTRTDSRRTSARRPPKRRVLLCWQKRGLRMRTRWQRMRIIPMEIPP